jgi:ribosomal protein L37AE/L43A
MKHFRNPGQELEQKWLKATRRVEKSDNSLFPRPLKLLYALLLFYLIRRKTQHEKHEEVANYYIRYTKASLKVYLHLTRLKRKKARSRKSVQKDVLRTATEIHACKRCESKKHLNRLYTRITEEGRVEYICQTCPRRKHKEQRQKNKKSSRTSNTRQDGFSIGYYRKVLGLQDEELSEEKIPEA